MRSNLLSTTAEPVVAILETKTVHEVTSQQGASHRNRTSNRTDQSKQTQNITTELITQCLFPQNNVLFYLKNKLVLFEQQNVKFI